MTLCFKTISLKFYNTDPLKELNPGLYYKTFHCIYKPRCALGLFVTAISLQPSLIFESHARGAPV
jgi:hypothetical protein